MTDKELLELAAKAVGIEKDDSPYNGGGKGNTGFDIMGNMVLDWHNNERWNPLTDDGDALRLAVKLELFVCTPDCEDLTATARKWDGENSTEEVEDGDHYAATRRCIVRAAAEIGRNM